MPGLIRKGYLVVVLAALPAATVAQQAESGLELGTALGLTVLSGGGETVTITGAPGSV